MTPRPLDPSVRLKRLEALADLWGKVYLFHPAIVSGRVQSPFSEQERVQARFSSAESRASPLDWNQALIRAIPRVEAAETTDDLAKAINEEMLLPLGDLLTYAYVKEATSQKPQATSGKLEAGRLSDSIGYLRIPSSEAGWPRDFLRDFLAAVEALAAVEKLVVDMRWYAGGAVPSDVAVMLRFFVRAGLLTGPVLKRVHQGWNEDNGVNAYKQEWKVIAGTRLDPIQQVDWPWARSLYGIDFRRSQTVTKPTVFLVNRPSAVGTYKILEALRSQTGVAVVYEPSGPGGTFPEFRLAYPEGLAVQLNTERLIGHDGQTGFRPDITASEPIGTDQVADIAEKALAAASRESRVESRESAAALINLRLPAPLSEPKESLSREERLLGLFKVWDVIRYLDPHLELCDMGWHSCLPEWIPKVEAADSLVAYVRILRMLTAHLHDNNVFYFFPNLPEPQALPVVFGWVEGKVVVTDVMPEALTAHGSRPTAASGQPSAVGAVGLEVGDELVELDGKTVPDLIAEHHQQVSYSTEGSFYQKMCDMLALGPSGSEVKLVLRRRRDMTETRSGVSDRVPSPDQGKMGTVPRAENEGQSPGAPASNSARDSPCFPGTVPILHITLKRTVAREVWAAHSTRKRGPGACRVLDQNIGYVDLSQLSSLAEFEHGFDELSRTDGLIIDIRGYPRLMVQLSLSARLNDGPVKSAIFEIPVVKSYDRMEQGWDIGQYEVKPDPKKHYPGPVVVLINERTRGTAEDLGIYLKDAKRVTFVGGPTAGCNGNRTWLSLPGAGRMFFTGMRVKFGDGSQFQNIGILPDVAVVPTVEGIRAGRDEVLEKGIEVLRRLVHRPSSAAPAQTRDDGQSDKGRRGP